MYIKKKTKKKRTMYKINCVVLNIIQKKIIIKKKGVEMIEARKRIVLFMLHSSSNPYAFVNLCAVYRIFNSTDKTNALKSVRCLY